MKDMNQPTTYVKLTQDELGYIIDALAFTAAMLDGEDDTMEFLHSKGTPVMLPLSHSPIGLQKPVTAARNPLNYLRS